MIIFSGITKLDELNWSMNIFALSADRVDLRRNEYFMYFIAKFLTSGKILLIRAIKVRTKLTFYKVTRAHVYMFRNFYLAFFSTVLTKTRLN